MPFCDLQDCVAFAVTTVPLQFYGYFFDMMSLFSCFAELNRDTANSLAVQHAVAKASYGSKDAALVLLLFGIVIPVVFGKHLLVLQPLPLIVKFEDWAGVGGKREQAVGDCSGTTAVLCQPRAASSCSLVRTPAPRLIR
jgi:hypothetical protein